MKLNLLIIFSKSVVIVLLCLLNNNVNLIFIITVLYHYNMRLFISINYFLYQPRILKQLFLLFYIQKE